ncbi:MAG: hypothetical protein AAF235_11895 [Planctomycetota bacterium]
MNAVGIAMMVSVVSVGVASAQPRLEVVGNPLAGTGFTPIGFAGGSNLLGIRAHADGGWEYAEATPTGVEVFDFAHIDPSRPRASRIRGDWFLLPGTDPTRRDHVIAATRDGGFNQAWSTQQDSRYRWIGLGDGGEILGNKFTTAQNGSEGFAGVGLFETDGERFAPASDVRSADGILADGTVFVREPMLGERAVFSFEMRTLKLIDVPYDIRTDIVVPFESVSAHGVVLGDIDAVGSSSTDSLYTHVDGVTTVLEFAPTVDRSELVDANRNGLAIGAYWDLTLADQNALDWSRSALWVDGELFNFRDIIELPDGVSAGGFLSLSDSNEILATVNTTEGAEFIVVRVVPGPGTAGLVVVAGLTASRRRR